MKILRKILWGLVYILPAVLFFSYHPIISLGSNDSMNFELSLPLIWLVFFDLLSFLLLIILWRHQKARKAVSLKATFATNEERTERAGPRNESCRRREKSQTSFELFRDDAQESECSEDGRRERSRKRDGATRFLNRLYLSSLLQTSQSFSGISDKRFFLLALLPLYLTFSILWSANPLRGLLVAGVMWLVFFAVFAILFVLPLGGTPKKLRTHILLIFFIATVLVCKYCYAQSFMDVLGVDRDTTLLCLGCTYRSFGFPHPSGFAIEPQFMGNLLLAPTLTALYLVVFRNQHAYRKLTKEADRLEDLAEQRILFNKIKLPHINWPKWQKIGLCLLAGFFSMTLFFTFSRGAIYAYIIALIVLLIFAIKRKSFRWSIIAIPVVTFVLSLGLQGTFAAIGPTSETFISAVTKSIHQLSLGIIDLRPATSEPVDNSITIVENLTTDCGNLEENSSQNVENQSKNVDNNLEKVENSSNSAQNSVENSSTNTIGSCIKPANGAVSLDIELFPADAELPTDSSKDSTFDGYVAESTNIRLSLNSTAIKTWLSQSSSQTASGNTKYAGSLLARALFGVGLGGAGTAMHQAFPAEVTSPKEIVQNEFFSLLLESGLVGIALVIFGLLIAFFPHLFSRKFLDGRAATIENQAGNHAFWHHPALPLLLSMIIAYLITLNFFSGLPNALQIYLMPPLLYLIFLPSDQDHRRQNQQ